MSRIACNSVAALGGCFALLAIADAGMVGLALSGSSHVLQQRGVWVLLIELSGALSIYCAVGVFMLLKPSNHMIILARWALVFGGLSGVLECINLMVERGWSTARYQALVSVGFMLVPFVLWGIAGGLAARQSGSLRSGIASATASGAFCMLIAVAAGFLVEFWIAPPNLARVASWAEFKRSGWADVLAFRLANTLDSGLTHLVIAPLIGVIFGSVFSFVMRRVGSKSGV